MLSLDAKRWVDSIYSCLNPLQVCIVFQFPIHIQYTIQYRDIWQSFHLKGAERLLYGEIKHLFPQTCGKLIRFFIFVVAIFSHLLYADDADDYFASYFCVGNGCVLHFRCGMWIINKVTESKSFAWMMKMLLLLLLGIRKKMTPSYIIDLNNLPFKKDSNTFSRFENFLSRKKNCICL